MQEFLRLSKAMVENRATEPGPRPPNMISKQWSFLTPVVLDSVPSGGCSAFFSCYRSLHRRYRERHRKLRKEAAASVGGIPVYISGAPWLDHRSSAVHPLPP